MKVTIDRIENETAAVELPDGRIIDVPCAFFSEAREGDIYTVEKECAECETRRRKIKDKMDKLFVE